MSLPKLLAIVALMLFGTIGTIGLVKKWSASRSSNSSEVLVDSHSFVETPIEIALDPALHSVTPALLSSSPPPSSSTPSTPPSNAIKGEISSVPKSQPISDVHLPSVNRIDELFNKTEPKLPYVETITYKSHVPWQKGRPAWLSDYASHYNTSRHFIARSLNGKPDYFKQELAEGDKFNVLRMDKNFEFYLVVDTSRCQMWFYIIDLDEKKNVLLKTYSVGLGRLDPSKISGLLTPLGEYSLGSRVAIFKPKVTGMYQGKKTEMITVFGTRWIPFEKELKNTTEPAKGFGIHGTPWSLNAQGVLVESVSGIGKYESDGCIRLATPDIEELFAIIISRPATIEIVRDFSESSVGNHYSKK